MARALTELLDLRHTVLLLPKLLETIREELGVSQIPWAQVKPALMQWFGQMGDLDGLRKRYREAVTLVSEYDPVLAFRLRSKDVIADLNQLRDLAALEEDASLLLWQRLENSIFETLEELLDEVILELAGRHSWSTKREVRDRLESPVELPPELREFYTEFQELHGELIEPMNQADRDEENNDSNSHKRE